MIKYLAKANDDVLSHCRCEGELASLPGQLDCPWCGCGWLIACGTCRRAFVYAKVIEVDASYEKLVRADFERRGYAMIKETDIRHDAQVIEEMLSPFSVGDIVVYLDGVYHLIDEAPVEFEGMHARHKMARLPHATALTRPEALLSVLGDPGYWRTRERKDRATN